MNASLKLDKSALDELANKFNDPVIKSKLENLPKEKGIIALVCQAIADNFTQEGPGWAPLKPLTIRASVAEKKRKQLSGMSDEELMKHEAQARKSGGEPHRHILKRTGLLEKSVTTPGAKGNVWKTEGSNLIWGTDLVYAAIHNNGGVITPKRAKALAFPNGQGGTVFAKKVTIPKREFLVIRDHWMKQLNDYVLDLALKTVIERIKST